MSQSGKQFLSGLMNRVFRSNKESRAATRRRERSLSARRLGMEPLEDRQLLAVDPTLLAAGAAADSAQTTDFYGPDALIDLSSATPNATGATVSVSNGAIAETTVVSTSEGFQLSVDATLSNASLDVSPKTIEYPSVGLPTDSSDMGWAASLANMLSVSGWGDVKDVVADPSQSVARQVFNYFKDNFTNDPSSVYYAFAWYMNGKDAYIVDGQYGWASAMGDGGNLFPVENGEFESYESYVKEYFAERYDSPLDFIKNNCLAENQTVGIEVHYTYSNGEEVGQNFATQPKKSWLTLWGVEHDQNYVDENGVAGTYATDDPRCYKAVLVSDPQTGKVERYEVKWVAARNAYVFTDYATSADSLVQQTPYIYSFTALEKTPGYGETVQDDYEKNNNEREIDANANVKTNPDLGVIDGINAAYGSGDNSKGNDVALQKLRLDTENDPVDYYRFELTHAASNADSIVLEYATGQFNSAITMSLAICGDDSSILPLSFPGYDFVDGRFDAKGPETVVRYTQSAETGKVSRSTIYRETISLAGLPAGRYYLKVAFADPQATKAVNENYSLVFHSGYDDSYETNDSFEDVEPTVQAPDSARPVADLGVVGKDDDDAKTGSITLPDLVLKQYARNEVSETDWFRFETTEVGAVVEISYNSTESQENDSDLDLYLYRLDSDDPRGYSLVKASCERVADIETLDLPDLPAGVYYAKVVGFKGAGSIHYKLSIKANVADKPDLRVQKPENLTWSAPLVVSSEKSASVQGAFSSSDEIGKRAPIYLNFNVQAAQTKAYDAAKLALYVNGRLVANSDVLAQLERNQDLPAYARLKALFGDGYDWADLETLFVTDFNIGKISDSTSLAGKYLSDDPNAINAITLVVNPQNYDLGAFYAYGATEARAFAEDETVVYNGDELTYREGAFRNAKGEIVRLADGATIVARETLVATYKNGKFFGVDGTSVKIPTGSTVVVTRGNKTFDPFVYPSDEFEFKTGDVVSYSYDVQLTKYFGLGLVANHKIVVRTPYQAVEKVEYNVDNNIASSFFLFVDNDDDAFAPNGSPAEVDANENPTDENPDLGYLNAVGLKQNDDGTYSRTLEDLAIVGKQNADGSHLSDWFKFTLIKSSEEGAPSNYENFRIDLNIEASALGGYPDLDMEVYEVVQNDPNMSFNEAYARGEYKLYLVARSAGTSGIESLSYQKIKEGKVGKSNAAGDAVLSETYFVRVSGFNGAKGRYSLDFANFEAPIPIAPPSPQDYFDASCASAVNSVVTLDWSVKLEDRDSGKTNPRKWTNQYVAETIVEYRKKSAAGEPENDWIKVDAKNIDGAKCKISGLDPETTYEFRLTASNDAKRENPELTKSTIVSATTERFMNEVVYRAIVVGVSDYPGAGADVVSAANDAKAFRDALLQDPQWCPENVFLLTDSAATRETVFAKMKAIEMESDDNDVFVFYFAGSGMYRIPGGRRVGYLKTYGSSTAQYISNEDLNEWASAISAGSKQFVLDAGQAPFGSDSTTTADYDVFVNSLVGSTRNGSSDRPAQVAVLTSGQTGQVSPTSSGARSDFSRALIAGMSEATKVDDNSEIKQDERVTFAELYKSVAESSSYVKNGLKPIYVLSGAEADATLANGQWSEKKAFDDRWIEENAVVVTTTVDSLDARDGKTSLREALAAVQGMATNPLKSTVEQENGAKFDLLQGSKITLGTRYGVLLGDVEIVYANGTFKTAKTCEIEVEGGKTYEFKAGAIVGYDDFADVKMVGAQNRPVSKIEYNKYATFGSDISDNEKFNASVRLDANDVLKTSLGDSAKTIVLQKDDASGRFRLYCEGVEYTKTYAYLDGERVTLSDRAVTTQEVVLTKIVFDASLAGQALTSYATVDANGKTNAAPFKVDFEVTIDATSAAGTLSFDGQNRSEAFLKIEGSSLVSLVGLKIANVRGGAAIEVAENARFELANSLIYGCDGGAESVVSNAGTTSIVNVTFANNAAANAVVENAATGTLELYNSLFALDKNAEGDALAPVVDRAGTFVFNDTNYDSALVDPGFADAQKNDYRLNSSKSPACDRGDSSKTRLQCGVSLDYDLQGGARVSYGSIDAGAYEYVVDPSLLEKPSTVVTTLEDVVDLEDGEISLREAFFYAGTEYSNETDLPEGAIVVAENGFEYEVKDGKFIAFLGASATEQGVFYKTTGVYLVDARGAATLLANGETVMTAAGDEATVVDGRLVRGDGTAVREGETIRSQTAESSTTGTLAYSAAYSFAVGQSCYATLAASQLDNLSPALTTFDVKEYQATFNANGTFSATVQVTTTDANNQATTVDVAITFNFREDASIVFRGESGLESGAQIASTRTTKLANGVYTLEKAILDTINGEVIELYPVGTQFTLKDGVFVDPDKAVVRVPSGTEFFTSTGKSVVYVASNSTEYVPIPGEKLTLADGSVRKFKEGTTVYETVRLGTNITFAPELVKKGERTTVLQRGAIAVNRAITLDATDLGGLTIDANSAGRVFTINSYRENAANDYVVFTGLTLLDGAAENGGAISIAPNSNVRLVATTIKNASATEDGGAIWNAGKLVLAASTTIDGAQADGLGGAIYNAGTLSVEGTISNTGASSGGAIYNLGGVSLVGATIANANASGDGGAIYNAGSFSATKKTALTGGSAANGGAIYNVGTVNVNSTTFRDNSATQSGGAIYSVGAGARVSLTSATFAENEASVSGGAVYAASPFFATRSVFGANAAPFGSAVAASESGSVTIVNSLILANENGVALASDGSASLFLTNDTLYGNKAGAILADGSSLTVFNSIVGGNGLAPDVDGVAAEFVVQYNMIERSTRQLDATNLTVFAPDFRSVDGTDWALWNLRLSAGSAAIDAGSLDVAYYFNFNGVKTFLTNDFAGNPRPNGPRPDMGAYEIDNSQETPSTIVTTLDDVFDPYDGLISLREAVAYASTGNSETTRTVTFSPELFETDPDKQRVVYLNSGVVEYKDAFGGSATTTLGTIVIQSNVVVTAAYEKSDGELAYRNLAIDGRGQTSLFMKTGSGDAELRGLVLQNGSATGDNPNGGAILLRQGSLSVVDCYVVGNKAANDGGALYQKGGSLFVVDSLFADNVAQRFGGAIYVEGGRAYIYNATIAKNDAELYGGVISNGSNILTLANSIVAENGGAQNCDLYVASGNLNAVSNLIGAMDKWANLNGFNRNYVGTPDSPLAPLFVGDLPDSDARLAGLEGKARYAAYFGLQSNSLAVNSGVNEYANGPDGVRLKLDLNAQERIVGEVVDMGAFESAFRDVPSTIVTTLVDSVDQTDGAISLREALSYSKLLGTTITFDLGENADGATIQLDPELGPLDVATQVAIDASAVRGGVTIVGDEGGIFRVLKAGSQLSSGSAATTNGALVLTNMILTGGSANRGGAVYMNGGSLSATNCLIYGNKATVGGAIYVATAPLEPGATVKLLNTTVAGNDAESFPGVYFGSARGTLSLQNSIVAANATETSTAVENYDLNATGSFAATASVVGCALDAFAAQWNGVNGVRVGTLAEMVDAGFVAPESNDFSLNADSIAVNRGSNRLIGQAGYYSSILYGGSNVRVLLTDVVGAARLVGGTVDVGAYEYQLPTEKPSVVVTTLDDVVDPFDGKISLREAIDYAGSAYYEGGLVVKVGRTITFDASLAGGTIALTETLDFAKCLTIDATGLAGGMTIAANGEFGALIVNAIPDSVASEVVLAGLTITGGSATSGAGVYHVGGDLTMLDCLVYGNQATFGAGVRSDAGTLSLINVTITKNAATYAYGGVYSIGASVVFRNALIAKNQVAGETGYDVYVEKIAEMRSSLIGSAHDRVADAYHEKNGALVGKASAPIDPSFVDWAKNDFSLGRDKDGFNSVAINSGDNAATVYPNGAVPATDANGDLRFVGGTVDMGALESKLGPAEMPSLIVTTVADVVDPYDGLISLREAVAYADNYNLEKTITFAPSINGSTFYLKKELTINADLTIDGLANGAQGFVLTTADDVNDQRIIYVNNGAAVLNGLTITNRRYERLQSGLDDFAIAEGGAIYVRAGSLAIYNSLICDSAANEGSAIYLDQAHSASAKLVNCTVVDNIALDANADGAAIYAGKNSLSLWNTIVASNKSVAAADGQTAQDVYVLSNATASILNSYVSYSDSLTKIASGNGSYIGSAKLDLSSETARLFVDVDNRDYRLNGDSLATNAGSNVHLNAGVVNGTFDSFDVDGKRRVYYTTVDMGAFENQTAQDAPIASVAGSGATLRVSTALDVVDPNDGATSLREALALADRMAAIGYDATIYFADSYAIKLKTSCLQINSPVTIYGSNGTIDCDYSNCAFLVDVDGAVTISNLIIKNGVGVEGAGIKLTGGDLTLRNSLIYNGEASVAGGAIYTSSDGTLSLYNVTLAKNVAAKGSGLYATGSGDVKLYNSIVATNRSSTIGETAMDVEFPGVVDIERKLVSDDLFTGEIVVANTLIGNVATKANVAKLAANASASLIGYGDDGAIDPKFLDASSGNFRLSPTDSPAKGAGSIDYASGVDLNGNLMSAPVSMGAYQIGRETVSFVVTTEQDVVDPYDGLISLREAINYSQTRYVDVVYGGHQAGTGRMNNSAYAAENAMNNASVYSGTYIDPITFDKSLAGKTIVLNGALGGFTFDRYNTWTNSLQDYMIDASSLSGLGGIAIDASAVNGVVFDVQGDADEANGWFWPIHLDLRNVQLIGSGGNTAINTNAYAAVTIRDCLIRNFGTALYIGDDDADDGAVAHVYSSTFAFAPIIVGGKLYAYNTILCSPTTVRVTTANPSYRTANYYHSVVGGTSGLARHTLDAGCTGNSADAFAHGLSVLDLFVDAANNDFRLSTYACCINAGANVYRRTLEPIFADAEVDLNGNARVEYETIDMGCYENQSVVDVPSTVVTTLEDVVDPSDGEISIREALTYAQQWSTRCGNVVKFDSTLKGGTIVLKDGALQITRDVKFDGGDLAITLSGNSASSIFNIAIEDTIYSNLSDVQLSNLTLTAGATDKNGGAINIASGNVKLAKVNIYGCSAAQYGGAIYAYDSELYLVDCKIGGNSASYYGGVVNQFGRTVLEKCYVAENSGLKQNADVWGYYPENFAHSVDNAIGFVKDVKLYDGVDGNKIGTQDNPIRPFVSVATGNLAIKPESDWRKADVSSAALDDAFALFVDEDADDEFNALEIDLSSLETTAFDDDLIDSLND